MEEMKKHSKKKPAMIGLISIIGVILLVVSVITGQKQFIRQSVNPELARAMTYEQFQEGSEKVDGTDNVNFSAFFLRDINNDGNAEKMKGTAKEIGKDDTLYMELNVQTEGYLKNAKIEIDGKNFYFNTNLVKDEQLKDNYIGNNVKSIEFNEIANGTHRLLTGVVRSGDYGYSSKIAEAIGDNINHYSRDDNRIVLTGTYVAADGTETAIQKVIYLTMDWYGSAIANLADTTQYYRDIQDRIDRKNNAFVLEFEIVAQETSKKLILSKNHVEGILPDINGYQPMSVSGVDTYDEESRQFMIEKTATVDEEGIVTSKVPNENKYKVQVKYPLEAYQSIGSNTVTIAIPINTYYEGYNNPNAEFENPIKSNVSTRTLLANYSEFSGSTTRARFFMQVEKSVDRESNKNVISKRKPTRIYNGLSAEEKEDIYRVQWRVETGAQGSSTGMVMKETENGKQQVSDQFIKRDSTKESMEKVTTNIGIGFALAGNILEADGWIKVYDDETDNLIVTFTNQDWNQYTADNPYRYETPVKHIRVETSACKKDAGMSVYCIKELDDGFITTHYTKEEFENLQFIQSTLSGYMDGQFINTDTHQAKYEAEYATASIAIENTELSTQVTERNNRITISAKGDSKYNQLGWVDGSFLIKFPEEVLTAQINQVEIDNPSIDLLSYELVKKDGCYFIKINTQNKHRVQESFLINLDVDLTPNPTIMSATKDIALYAANDVACDYQPEGEDIYDVNDNLNTTERVVKATASVQFIAPNSLLTNEIICDYDEKGSIAISPEIADMSKTTSEKEERKATVGIQLKNNYTNTISETSILGKIPFEGNTYVLSGGNLESNYTTKMTKEGIQVPEELQGKVKVYYSENQTPTKDVLKVENGWKTASQVTNWDEIKTYFIDFQNTVIEKGKQYTFYYTIQVPNNLKFNQVSYSHHGVYFSLDTANGKYRTQTEPSKMGLRVVKTYDLTLTKYQSQMDKLVPGAVYRVREVVEDTVEEKGKTAVTNAQGQLMISDLYAEKIYEIEEIKTPKDYALNADKIRYTTRIDSEGNLVVEKLQGTTKQDMTVTKKEGETSNVTVVVEDEVKATLKIIKKEKDTDKGLGFVSYELKGKGFEEGQIQYTDVNGNVSLKGLFMDETYTLQEKKATGYYLANPIKFKIVNRNGTYEAQIEEGVVKDNTITEVEHIPTLCMTLENEKIPTYDLAITKIGKTTHLDTSHTTAEETMVGLSGARFKLYKDKQEIGTYTTNEDGQLMISGLYQYVEGKDEIATYTLKEVIAPTGYSKIKDITFQVQQKDGKLQLQTQGDGPKEYDSDKNTVRLQLEDTPVFKLTKKDGETGDVVPNVKFAIYDMENNEQPAQNSKGEILGNKEVINEKEYYVLTTDGNGEISADLQEGKYQAVELQAPEKYQISDRGYYFSIGSNQSDTGFKTQWANDIPGFQVFHTVIQTSDGGYLASVNTLQNGTNGVEVLYKYSDEGNEQWNCTLGNRGTYENQIGSNLVETTEGDYISCLGDGTVVKIGSNGIIQWRKKVIESTRTISSLAKTAEGGFLLVGQNNDSDGIIVKCNGEGNVQETKIIDFSNYGYVTAVKETKEGGFVLGGYFANGKAEFTSDLILAGNGQTGFIAKYNETGEVQWAKLTGNGVQKVTSVLETSKGEYLLGEYTEGTNTVELGDGFHLACNDSDKTGIIIKYDNIGNIQWANAIKDGKDSSAETIIESKDGGYVIGVHFTKTFTLGENIILSAIEESDTGAMIKYNAEGEAQWAKVIGRASTGMRSILQTNQGDYVIGGTRYAASILDLGDEVVLPSYPSDYNNIAMLIKFRATEITNPEIQQGEPIGGNGRNEITSIAKTQDGGYIAGGWFSCDINLGNGKTLTNHGETDGMILKYNQKGEIEWSKVIGSNQSDGIHEVIQTLDGGYLVAGYCEGTINLDNGFKIKPNGMLIKYNSQAQVEWVQSNDIFSNSSFMGGITALSETEDGGYLIGGTYHENHIDLGNGVVADSSIGHGGIIAKYNLRGEAQWVKLLEASSSWAAMTSIVQTTDGGYIVSGFFPSNNNLSIGNDTYLQPLAQYTGMMIKYDKERNPEWNHTYPVTYNDVRTAQLIETQDGGYAIGVTLTYDNHIDLGNGVVLQRRNTDSNDFASATLIKYNSRGETQWAKSIQDRSVNYVHAIEETKNAELIIVGKFGDARIELENGIVLNNHSVNSYDGFVVKYDNKGETKWAQSIGLPEKNDTVNAIAEVAYGIYAVGGRFNYDSTPHSSDASIVKIEEKNAGVQELEVENTRKEFEIVTAVQKREDITGGSISGEGEKPYEVVKYGDTNTKQIKMIPEEGYEILNITVNGEDYAFEKTEDGSFTMPAFTNVMEDKQVVVTYTLTDYKLTLHKIDQKTKQPLEGATFSIEQASENDTDTNLENVIGDFRQKTIEDPDFSAIELIRNQMYYFEKVDDKYIATNSNAYQISTTTANTIATSFMPINLIGKTGKYRVEINAQIDSEETIGIGYATISDTGVAPSYDNPDGRFMYLTGNVSAQNYSCELEGGKTYYLHVGYKKGDSDSHYNDKMIINGIKVYQPAYHFDLLDGKYQLHPEMSDKKSYLPIDLTNHDGNYVLKVNAEIISEAGKDIGYAIITESEEIPDSKDQKAFMKLSGKQEAKDYTTTLQGGKMYYLYLGYDKTGSTPIEKQAFVINHVEVKPYGVQVTTNQEGQASAQIPFGKYNIIETEAPQGYLKSEEPVEIEFVAGGKKEFTIENKESAKIVVHHVIKGTNQKIAEDEIIEGKEGDTYRTQPQMDLEKYTLEVDGQGRFIVPENASGKFTTEKKEVIYEYVEKQIPLTVYHYIEGTMNQVPLANGQEADVIRQAGKEGESYTTHPIAQKDLSPEYELAQIPVNSTGVYEKQEISVTYYYKKVERKVRLTKYQEDGVTPLPGAKFIITAKNKQKGEVSQDKTYITNAQGEIEVTLEYGIYEVTEIEAPKGYVLPENPTTEVVIDKEIQNKQLNITNAREKGTVIVHYYIEGTKEKVPLADGTVAEDLVMTGEIGSIYATKELTNVSKKYELKAIPINASGLIKKDTTEVIYYYKAKEKPVVQDVKLVKTSDKQTIMRPDEKIPYTITYTGVLNHYKGDAIVTIVDELPYEIEVTEGKSDLAGGIYDAKNKTITWTEKIEGIDTDTEGKRQISITKAIEVTYKNLDSNTTNLSNKVTGQIKLLDTDGENPTEPSEPIGKTEETNQIPIDIFTKVDVTLMWVDSEEEKQLRPEKLILQVKKDGEVVASKEITITKEEDSDIATFEKLPKYDENGNQITYTVDETVLPGEEHKDDLQYYEKTIEGTTITNTIDKTINQKQGKVIVEHIDKKTGNVLKTIVKIGKIGEICQTTKEEIEGYELVDSPKDSNIVITEVDQKVTYYYERIASGIIEKHIDINTKEVLYHKTHTGQQGDKYTTQAKTFEGFDLMNTPINAQGEMTADIIEVVYCYSRRASVKVEHLEKGTGNKIAEDVKITGHENDAYTTEKKDIKGYVLAENPTNQKGKMEVTKKADGTYQTETVVQYYYTKKRLQVVEEYVNIEDNTVIETIIHEGTIGDQYEVHPKEIEGYELVDKDENGNSLLPNNNKGIITEEKTTVRYYYKKKAKVVVKYLDQLTKEEIETEEIHGYVGDSYQTKEKQWEGYDLVETAQNATGKMTANTIEVKYYYRRKTQVEVQYLEKQTNQILSDKETINGYVGDKYQTKRKGIPCYEYVESTGNEEGYMTKDKIIVKYYFEKQEFNLRVDSWISNVVINGVTKGGKTLSSKEEIYKLDIHRNQVNSTEVKVTYKIRVSNVGQAEGSVITLTDVMPNGFSYHQEDNKVIWTKAGGILTTTQMKGQMLKAGENREIELVLRWNKGEENLKEKINTVTISEAQSLAGFQETNQEDNVSTAGMLISIATGMDNQNNKTTIIAFILGILTLLLGILAYLKRRK